MSDARPLIVSLGDRQGALFISFEKTGEGLLAEGRAQVCDRDGTIEARFERKTLQLGAAASWMLKGALRAGAAVTLQRTAPGKLRIGTLGWNGEFIRGSSTIGLKANVGTL